MTAERIAAATVEHRDGAWFISVVNPMRPVKVHSCSGALLRAKRSAVEQARRFGYWGPPRWTTSFGDWVLMMRLEDE